MKQANHCALIAVTRCVPGMIMSASTQCRLFKRIGITPYLYLDTELLSLMGAIDGVSIVDSHEEISVLKPEIVLINNVGTESLKLARLAKEIKSKSYYILHEPFTGFRRILQEGSSRWIKAGGAYILNALICNAVDTVLLPSDLAYSQYCQYMRRLNSSYRKFPLSYSDPDILDINGKRQFFSFIGSFVDAHAADDFLGFIKYASKIDPSISFLIATRTNIDSKLKDQAFQRLRTEGRLIVQAGRSLSEPEMSVAYQQSICCWCAYRISTQSGVAVSALQHGTPIIATHSGSMDDCGSAAEFVSSPMAYSEILAAYKRILEKLDSRVILARKTYLSVFDYKSHLDLAREVFCLDHN